MAIRGTTAHPVHETSRGAEKTNRHVAHAEMPRAPIDSSMTRPEPPPLPEVAKKVQELLSKTGVSEVKDGLEKFSEILADGKTVLTDDHLTQLQGHAKTARAAVSDGVWNAIKQWFSSSHKNSVDAVKTKYDAIQEQVGEYKKSRKAAEAESPHPHEALGTGVDEAPNRELEDTKKELAKLKSEHDELGYAKTLATKTHESALKDVTNKLKENRVKSDGLQHQVDSHASEIEEQKNAASTLQEKIARLNEQLKEARAEQSNSASTASTVTTLRDAVAAKATEILALTKDNDKLNDELGVKGTLLTSAQKSVEKLTTENTGLISENNYLQLEDSKLINKNGESKREIQKLKADLTTQADEHQAALEKLEKETMTKLIEGLMDKFKGDSDLYEKVLKKLSPQLSQDQ